MTYTTESKIEEESMMADLFQPHDKFFRKVFSQTERIEDILIHNIPMAAELIVPGTVELCQDKHVNEELKNYYSDLLLKSKIKSGEDAYFYILLEHKSFHDPQTSFNMLQYILRIWETLNEKPLPFIFPIVIYHGKKQWSTDYGFSSLVTIPPGMDRFVPHFDFYLYDLSQHNDEDIKGEILSRVSMLLLKHIYNEDFGYQFIQICDLLAKLGNEKSVLDYMRSVLEYISATSDRITREQVQEGVIRALPKEGGKLMPTLFEQLKEEGRVEGREEGREEGQIEILKELIEMALEMKFGGEGLSLYSKIHPENSVEKLKEFKQALKDNKPLSEIKELINCR